MRLGVTNLGAYQTQMTSLCAQWQPHRHATAYRIVIESLIGKSISHTYVAQLLRSSLFVTRRYSSKSYVFFLSERQELYGQ